MRDSDKLYVLPENAERLWEWVQTRGGVAVWKSINLSNPDGSWSTPACALDGTPTPKPTWECGETPERIIADPAKILVTPYREVKRIRVDLRESTNGLMLKLTPASARRLNFWKERLAEKYGRPTWHVFDYETVEARIMVETESVPLAAWNAMQKARTLRREGDNGRGDGKTHSRHTDDARS